MKAGTVELVNGVFVFTGFLNENVPLNSVRVDAGEALRLDLGAMTALNSVGMRSFSQMIRAHGVGEVEIHRAPVCFVEAVNSVPSLVGGAKFGRRVKSFHVPYQTRMHKRAVDVLVSTDAIQVTSRGIVLPAAKCPETGQEMRPTVVLEDHLMFLLYTP